MGIQACRGLEYIFGKFVANILTAMKDELIRNLSVQNRYSGQVVNSAMKVHSKLGPGLLENAYEVCLIHELKTRGLAVQAQVELPVKYDGIKMDIGYRIDLLIEHCLIVELKAVEKIMPLHRAQLISYLKLSGIRLGLLINFNTISLRDGIQRIINGY